MTDSPVEDALEALAHGYRRQLLLELRENNPHGELPTGSLGTRPPNHLAVEMTHLHLPKLDDYGFVEWDRGTGTVLRGPRFEEVAPLLEVVADEAYLADDEL